MEPKRGSRQGVEPRVPHKRGKLSFAPLEFTEAVRAALATGPMPKRRKKRTKAKKG